MNFLTQMEDKNCSIILLKSNQTGEPWLIPADGFDVVRVKPLSLNDLAIKDSVKWTKRQ